MTIRIQPSFNRLKNTHKMKKKKDITRPQTSIHKNKRKAIQPD